MQSLHFWKKKFALYERLPLYVQLISFFLFFSGQEKCCKYRLTSDEKELSTFQIDVNDEETGTDEGSSCKEIVCTHPNYS